MVAIAQKSTLRDKQKIDKIKKVVGKDAEDQKDCYTEYKKDLLQSELTAR